MFYWSEQAKVSPRFKGWKTRLPFSRGNDRQIHKGKEELMSAIFGVKLLNCHGGLEWKEEDQSAAAIVIIVINVSLFCHLTKSASSE